MVSLLRAFALSSLFISCNSLKGPMFKETVSLGGRTAVITGGNSGLGKETAIKLASLGADTIVLCRNPSKAEDAVAEIKRKSGNQKVRAVSVDLNSLESIGKCSDELKSSTDKIDILVNNAGVMAIPNKETTLDGFEKQIGINHFGHFALTGQLFSHLKKSGNARVVNVASSAHQFSKIDRGDLMLDKKGAYQAWLAYGNSKLANILFTKELTKKLYLKSDANVAVLCCHPGVCRTELGRYLFDPESLPFPVPQIVLEAVTAVGRPLFTLATKNAEEGAQTAIYLSASRAISKRNSGGYYDNSKVSKTSSAAEDEDLSEWLWKESERLTGVQFSI